MKAGVQNFLIGLTTVGAMGSMFFLLVRFGELDRLVHPRYAVTIHSDHAAGLRRGSGVELNGVPIGIIGDVKIDPTRAQPVQVVALVNETVSIPADAVPYATASLLGGAAVLEIDAPTGVSPGTMLARDGSAILEGPVRFQMIEQLRNELDERMKPLTESLERFDELSTTFIEVGTNLNDLLQPQTEQMLHEGSPPNLRTTVARGYDALADIRDAVALARDWLDDEQLRTDARDSVAKASALMDQASAAITRYTKLADVLQSNTADVGHRAVEVADEISRTVEEVRRLASLATQGKGTVGQLFNNPDLYNALTDAAGRLEQAARQLQLLIEKIKAEGLSVGF